MGNTSTLLGIGTPAEAVEEATAALRGFSHVMRMIARGGIEDREVVLSKEDTLMVTGISLADFTVVRFMGKGKVRLVDNKEHLSEPAHCSFKFKSGSLYNSTVIRFPNKYFYTGACTIIGFILYTTTGNIVCSGRLTKSIRINPGDDVCFEQESLIVSVRQ